MRLFIIFIFLFSSCSYNDIDQIHSIGPIKQSPWINHPKFTLDQKIFFSSHADSQSLYFYGPNYLTNLSSKLDLIVYELQGNYPYRKRMPIGDLFFLELYNDTTIFIDPMPLRIPRVINLKDYDRSHLVSAFFHDGKEVMAINNKNQLLVSIVNDSSKIEKLILFDIDLSAYSIVKTYKIISIPYTAYCEINPIIQFIQEMDDYFIVSTGSTTFKVASDGSINKISGHSTLQIFKDQKVIYCLNLEGKMIKSFDNGVTWTEYTGVSWEWAAGIIKPIGDSLVFNFNSSFYAVKFNSYGEYFLRELENLGIDGNLVTTLTEFNDSIYATTYSGVYYKSKKDFFQSKLKK